MLCLYVATMPVLFPPDADAIRWAQLVESQQPTWEPRHLLAWPLERGWLGLARACGYEGKAFIPMQVLHAALAAAALGLLVWLLMRRGLGWLQAAALGVLIGLSYTWFEYARSAHVRIPSVACGVGAIVLALAASQAQLRTARFLFTIAVTAAAAGLLQLDGMIFPLVASMVAALRRGGRWTEQLVSGTAIAAASLALIAVAYGVVWHLTAPTPRHASALRWVSEHPEAGTLDNGPSALALARGGAGLMRALAGESQAVKAIKVALAGRADVQSASRPADWIALAGAVTVLTLGFLAVLAGVRQPSYRVEALAAILLLLLLLCGAFALVWSGSDAWLWLAPVAFLWCAVGLWAFRTRPASMLHNVLLALAVALSVVGCWRAIAAPCLLTTKSSPPVRAAIAYAHQSSPGDLLVGFYGWPDWVDYGFARQQAYLYHLSFNPNWRQALLDELRVRPASSRIYVTADVVEPTDIDTVEMWERVARSNDMPRAEVLKILLQVGELVRVDGMLPNQAIWELKRNNSE